VPHGGRIVAAGLNGCPAADGQLVHRADGSTRSAPRLSSLRFAEEGRFMYVTRLDKPGQKVRLDDISPDAPEGLSREEAQARLAQLGEELFELQDLLYGARTHVVLVVLQGRDTAGNDGVIKHVVGCLNPRGVSVVSFGVPTPEEQGHDFLWRGHRHAPRRGAVAIFTRSHSADVLVVRVHGLVPRALWRERYGHIKAFEELLAEHGTIVVLVRTFLSQEAERYC
jgi:polyphosphate kinase 2 (PPK2 family)